MPPTNSAKTWWLLLALACLILLGYFVHGQETNRFGFPEIPGAPPIDPLAHPNLLALPSETHASFQIDWIWPTNIAEYGAIPIKDVATNFSFLILSSPLLSNPEWRLKYVFPGSSLIPSSNYWYTNIYEDMATSAYFQIIVTNNLNRTTSTTTSIPSPTATSMLLSTPPTSLKSIIKNKS